MASSEPQNQTTPDPESSRPPEPRRQSSVRFSEDTNRSNSRSAMSNRRRESADEITPIRPAEAHTNRNYDTNERSGSGRQEQQPQKSKAGTKNPTTEDEADDEEEEDTNKDESSWYKRIAEKFGSVALDNKGSVARDHLALERTFLAWLRTSLAFASIGVAITQLFRLNTTIASRTKQYSTTSSTDLPFSPLLGQSIPLDILPYLIQQAISSASASSSSSSFPQPTTTTINLGPTLLDQLLLLPPPPSSDPNSISIKAFDEEAAAKLRHVGKPLGATFLGISIFILLIGFHRYFESQYWIIRGKFPASRGSIFLVGFIAGALILASLLVVLLVAPTSYEK